MSATELLELADLDRLLERLRAARRSLPERRRVEEIERELKEMSTQISEKEAQRVPYAARLRASSEEAERLRARLAHVEARLAQSTNAREAESLHDERVHVVSALEEADDAELAALIDLEPLDEAITEIKEKARPLIDERHTLLETLTGLEETLDEEYQSRLGEREGVANALEPGLLARYERALARVGGAGAARLEEGRCGGCHVSLAPADLDEVRRSTSSWVECPSCGRILVP